MSIRPMTRPTSLSPSCWAFSCRPRISSWRGRRGPSLLRSCSVLSRPTTLRSKESSAFLRVRSGSRMNKPCVSGSVKEEVRQMAAIIEVENLTKSYGSKRGIADVSFEVEEGEVFGFLGPTGADMTATIRLLMPQLHANSGSAKSAGLDYWTELLAINLHTDYM